MNWRRVGISLQWVVGAMMAVVAIAGAFGHAEVVGLMMLKLSVGVAVGVAAGVGGHRAIRLMARWADWVTQPDHSTNEKG